MRANTILDTVGNAPHVRINRLYASIAPKAEVWLKLERANPGGSIKDRIGVAMIEDAERRGVIKKGSVIVEPTSAGSRMVAIYGSHEVCLMALSELAAIEAELGGRPRR